MEMQYKSKNILEPPTLQVVSFGLLVVKNTGFIEWHTLYVVSVDNLW